MFSDDEVALGPQPPALGSILSELFAKRGYGRTQTNRQLSAAWKQIAGEQVARITRLGRLHNGTLHVSVSNSAALAELNGFCREAYQQRFQQDHPCLGVRRLKFTLDSNISTM